MNNKRKRLSQESSVDDNDNYDDQQEEKKKEFCEKCSKLEAELRQTKQMCMIKEFENKALQLELENQELMMENNELKAKMAKMEQEQPQQNNTEQKKREEEYADQLSQQQTEFCAKIGEFEQKLRAAHDAFASEIGEKMKMVAELQEKVITLEKRQKEQNNSDKSSVGLLKYQIENEHFDTVYSQQQNWWDNCHNDLTISADPNNLEVHYKGNGKFYRSVFAKHSILNICDSSDIFYFEILVKNMKDNIIFGIAIKQNAPLGKEIHNRTGTCAYVTYGYLWINGTYKRADGIGKFGTGDRVGFGANLATKQLFFTKNGRRIGPTNLFFAHSADELFPFVAMCAHDDKIEANFGPNFKFNLANLTIS